MENFPLLEMIPEREQYKPFSLQAPSTLLLTGDPSLGKEWAALCLPFLLGAGSAGQSPLPGSHTGDSGVRNRQGITGGCSFPPPLVYRRGRRRYPLHLLQTGVTLVSGRHGSLSLQFHSSWSPGRVKLWENVHICSFSQCSTLPGTISIWL